MRVPTLAALALTLAVPAAGLAGASFHVNGYAVPCPAPYPYPVVPYAYPVAPGYGALPPVPYGAPYYYPGGWYGWNPDYLYRLQPGFRFHEPNGRRGFDIRGYTLPGGR